MCQYEICGCGPVESGRLGPRITTVVDRRVRPTVRMPGDRRGAGEATERVQDTVGDAAARRDGLEHAGQRPERAGSLV